MRRILTIVLTMLIMAAILSGCNQEAVEQQELPVKVYSFSGENEYVSLSNGVIVLSAEEEVFYGGVLEEKEHALSDIKTFSTTFYVMEGEEKHTLLSNSVVDQTGGSIKVTGETGKISGDGILRGTDTQDWMNNLYFELKTTDLSGLESVFALQLELVEVT